MIPLCFPNIDDGDVAMVTDVLRSRHLASGPVAEQFEREFAARFGARHAIAVSSGTAALHLAMIAAGVKDGDFVITSPFSFIASSNAILYERGIPVFVDIEPDTLMLDSAKVIEAIHALAEQTAGWRALLPRHARNSGGALRAILPVHLFGCSADLRDVVSAAREAGIAVVEDACEAIGASSAGTFAGRWGNAAAFGFYPNKQITSGEGGMLLTDDDAWAELFRCLRNQGRGHDPDHFIYDRLGFNYRMDELSAALGLSQFRRFDELVQRRKAMADRYAELLAPELGLTPLPRISHDGIRTWFLYPVRLDASIDRDALMRGLATRGVMTRPYFAPIHLQPFYVERFGFAEGDFPVAEEAGRRTLALPLDPNLTDDEIRFICDAVTEELAVAAAR